MSLYILQVIQNTHFLSPVAAANPLTTSFVEVPNDPALQANAATIKAAEQLGAHTPCGRILLLIPPLLYPYSQ